MGAVLRAERALLVAELTLRDFRQRGDGLHYAVQTVARMHNLALAA
ncbi:hypothetical protein ACSYGO_44975 [Streptomyces krungchingensis]